MGFRIQDWGIRIGELGFRNYPFRNRNFNVRYVENPFRGFRGAWELGFRIQDSGFRIQELGFGN